MDWTQDTIRPTRLDLLETYWRFAGPSGRVFECSVYQTNEGLEVRAGYGLADALYAIRATDAADARQRAERLRVAMFLMPGFEELPGSGEANPS